jgi:predicted Zn-dependent protease
VVARATDPQTKIDVLEIRKGDKVEGRLKLFNVKEVQEYVTNLGMNLLPPAADVTARALEFRFYVVEDPSINAAALPDGTLLINTGLLGAVENESQLAFVLSHEIAHVLQAHHWREANDTRSKRVLLVIAAVAASGFIGDVGLFLGELGMAAVVNGYSRRVENQADRLGLQNVIDHGYDPRAAVTFFQTMVEHYGQRSTSALWSNHDSSLLRGSFLTVQLLRQYPQGHFDHSIVDTEKFQAMKDAMGPVKIM